VNSIILCEREGAPKASSNLGSKAIDQGYRYALDRLGQREIERDGGRLRCSLLKLLFLGRRRVDYLSNWVKTRWFAVLFSVWP